MIEARRWLTDILKKMTSKAEVKYSHLWNKYSEDRPYRYRQADKQTYRETDRIPLLVLHQAGIPHTHTGHKIHDRPRGHLASER